IMVKSDGTVKVLDFGLAKVRASEVARGAATPPEQSAALTLYTTTPGMILGTAAYMSPEQARGKNVDKRADIWAFGCVLYEMLVGKKAFHGEYASDAWAAILRADPDWSALPGDAPAAIPRLLHRCLEKDPKRRLHDIADARIEIDEARSAQSGAP